jgi:hypothetical protein
MLFISALFNTIGSKWKCAHMFLAGIDKNLCATSVSKSVSTNSDTKCDQSTAYSISSNFRVIWLIPFMYNKMHLGLIKMF